MASYSQWNKAIADFVTRDCGAGSPVYLNVTEDNLPDIAKGFDQRVDDPLGDFVAAVRSFAVRGGSVRPDLLVGGRRRASKPPPVPPGVAFLALTVVAAARMGQDAHPNDYFVHLNELLGTAPAGAQQRRPRGLHPGAPETAVWEEWAEWLRGSGYQPTHSLGVAAQIYVKLPKSQTLLRAVDVEALGRSFTRNQYVFNREFTENALMRRIQIMRQRSEFPGITVQIRDILDDENRRIDATPMFYDAHALWRINGNINHADVSTIVSARIRRQSDDDEVRYFVNAEGLDRRVVEVTPDLLEVGWEGTLTDGRTLRLRKRDLWILAQETEQTPFESVGRTSVGTTLLLLMREEVSEDLTRRPELPIDWEEEDHREVMLGWVERRCRVRVGRWPDQFSALTPPGRISISFSRGASVGGAHVWLKGRLPDMTISVSDSVRFYNNHATGKPLQIDLERIDTDVQSRAATWHGSPEEPIPLGDLAPGDWRVTVMGSVSEDMNITERAQQRFRVVTREELTQSAANLEVSIKIGTQTIIGASVL